MRQFVESAGFPVWRRWRSLANQGESNEINTIAETLGENPGIDLQDVPPATPKPPMIAIMAEDVIELPAFLPRKVCP